MNQRLHIARGERSGNSHPTDPRKAPGTREHKESSNNNQAGRRANTDGHKESPNAGSHNAVSYSEMVKQTRVGILPVDYPRSELTTTLLGILEESILSTVLQQRREQFKPKFASCQYKAGFMIINCQDQETADWLKQVVPTIKPWEGASLKAVDEEHIPRPEVLVAFLPKSAFNDNDTILALIESQNDLRTDAWRVLNRRDINHHAELILSVDETSMQKIAASRLVLNFKFGQIKLRKARPSKFSGS